MRSRIRANKSKGTVADILVVVDGVVNVDAAILELRQQFPASIALVIDGVSVDDTVSDIAAEFLRDSAAAGVRTLLEYSEAAPADTFAFSDSTGAETIDGDTFGDSTDPLDGGQFQSAKEGT